MEQQDPLRALYKLTYHRAAATIFYLEEEAQKARRTALFDRRIQTVGIIGMVASVFVSVIAGDLDTAMNQAKLVAIIGGLMGIGYMRQKR